jgi:hypothetical protein
MPVPFVLPVPVGGNVSLNGVVKPETHSIHPDVTSVEFAPGVVERVRRLMSHCCQYWKFEPAVGVCVDETVWSVFVAENAAGFAWVNASPKLNVGTVAVAIRNPEMTSRTVDAWFPVFWKYPAGTVIAGQPLAAVTADAVGTDADAAADSAQSSSLTP